MYDNNVETRFTAADARVTLRDMTRRRSFGEETSENTINDRQHVSEPPPTTLVGACVVVELINGKRTSKRRD